MAPKRLLQDPPAASSADEDSDAETQGEEEVQTQNDVVEDEEEEESGEEDEDEDDDDDDDDEEEENVDAKKPNDPNPKSESASSDDVDDGDSETESDDMNHSPSASDFTVKPIISQPAKKPAAPAKKRAAAEIDSNPRDSKKKRAANGDDEDTKKGRLWGEDDEIAVLQGMIELKKRGTDPFANMGAFHEFLKKSLKVDVSKNQLTDKARRLKKKYSTNAAKGEEAVFAKPHELKAFELSKRIWGVEANGIEDGETKKPRKSVEADSNDKKAAKKMVLALPASDMAEKGAEKNNVERKVEVNVANGGVKVEPEPEEFWTKYPNLSESLRVGSYSSKWEGLEGVLSQSLPSIGSSKAKGLDDKWRKLQISEMELAVEKLDLIREQAKLALEVMKSRKD